MRSKIVPDERITTFSNFVLGMRNINTKCSRRHKLKSKKIPVYASVKLLGKERKDTQLKYYKTKTLPWLMCGSETKTLGITDERWLESEEMRFLR